MTFQRITVNAEQMGGVPCIRGLRIPVATVIGMIAEGMNEQEILRGYPDLEPEDIREALRYAAEALRELPIGGGDDLWLPRMHARGWAPTRLRSPACRIV